MADARRRHKGGSPFGAGAGAPRSLSAGPLSCPRDEGSESRPVAANLREVGKTRALAHSELPPSHYRRTRNEGSESRLVVTRSNPKTISAYLFPQRRFGVEARCYRLVRPGISTRVESCNEGSESRPVATEEEGPDHDRDLSSLRRAGRLPIRAVPGNPPDSYAPAWIPIRPTPPFASYYPALLFRRRKTSRPRRGRG